MNLAEIVKKYQNKILDNGVLVEYNIFFDKINENICKFAVDERKGLEELNNVILGIKQRDKSAEIYVSTYGIDFSEKELHIYADTLWINTIIGLQEISMFFSNYQSIEPSDIVLLIEDETVDGVAALVVTPKSKVEEYTMFMAKRQLENIKSLYWD